MDNTSICSVSVDGLTIWDNIKLGEKELNYHNTSIQWSELVNLPTKYQPKQIDLNEKFYCTIENATYQDESTLASMDLGKSITLTPSQFTSKSGAEFDTISQPTVVTSSSKILATIVNVTSNQITINFTSTTTTSPLFTYTVKTKIRTYIHKVPTNNVEDALNKIFANLYPIGAIYLSTSSTFIPDVVFGGIWKLVTDKFLIGAGNNYSLGTTGGTTSHIHSLGTPENTKASALIQFNTIDGGRHVMLSLG